MHFLRNVAVFVNTSGVDNVVQNFFYVYLSELYFCQFLDESMMLLCCFCIPKTKENLICRISFLFSYGLYIRCPNYDVP